MGDAVRDIHFERQSDDLAAVRAHVEAMLARGETAAALDPLFELLLRLRDDHDALRVRLFNALRKLHGRSSERVSPEDVQLALAGMLGDAPPAAAPEAVTPDAAKPDEKPAEKLARGKPHGRSEMPTDMPKKVTSIPLSEEARTCPCCGKPVVLITPRRRWYYDFEPSSLFVRVLEEQKGVCPSCPDAGVVTAEGPAKLLPGGQVGPGLLARLLVEKGEDHLPLNRQRIRLAREGLTVPETTLADWYAQGATWLQPLADAQLKALLAAPLVQLDGTGLAVLDREHEHGVRQGTVWAVAVRGAGAAFRYEPGKSAGLAEVLGTLERLRQAPPGSPPPTLPVTRFVVDGEAAIATALANVVPLPPQQCQMHARRYFEKAFKQGDARAAVALDHYRRLYAIEARLTQEGAGVAERQRVREAESLPVLEALRTWLLELAPTVPPRTPLGKAIAYCAKRWLGLCLFVLEGALPLDTGEVERQLRRVAVGRRGWLFVGSDAAAQRFCAVATLCATCRSLGVDPWAYFRDILPRVHGEVRVAELPGLLPGAWAQEHPEHVQKSDRR